MNPRKHVLDGLQIHTHEGAILMGWPRTRPDMSSLAVDIIKVTQQGAERVWCGCQLGVLDGVHVGASWQM